MGNKQSQEGSWLGGPDEPKYSFGDAFKQIGNWFKGDFKEFFTGKIPDFFKGEFADFWKNEIGGPVQDFFNGIWQFFVEIWNLLLSIVGFAYIGIMVYLAYLAIFYILLL